MDDKTFLLDALNLADGISNNYSSKISTVITDFNNNTLTAVQLDQIKTTIISYFSVESGVSVDLLKSTINQVNQFNKNYLNALLDVKRINFNDKDTAKATITSKLQDTTITFDNDTEKFNFYYLIVNYTIVLKDSTLIQTAIDVIQSI